MLSQVGQTQQQQVPTRAASDESGEFISAVLGSTEEVWTGVLAQHGETYKPPTLVMFSGATQSGCGFAQSAMGPFYCPNDQKVYLDTSFFQDLERRFGACDVGSKTCQFAQAYVIAHEIGHHLQNQLGLLPRCKRNNVQWRKLMRIVCKSEWSCKQTASRESGGTARRLSGNSLSPETLKLQCRPLRPSEMTGCSTKRKAASCRTHSPTALQHNARVGS